MFTRTIGIDCSYKLEGKEYLTTELFNKFWIILGTYNTRTGLAIRLLELATRLRKRVARLIRSYQASTSTLSNIRDPIGIERNNPNNRTTLIGESVDDDDAIQLARRNSELQVPIYY